MRKPKKQQKPLDDLSRSLIPFDPNQTLTAVVELSKKTWLVAGIIPGIERQPVKKLAADENELIKLLERWRAEAEKAGHKITCIAVAFETGRDGFWLARWLRARRIEAHVIHAASVPVSRERSQCSGWRQLALQTKSEKYARKPQNVVALQPRSVKDPASAFSHNQDPSRTWAAEACCSAKRR